MFVLTVSLQRFGKQFDRMFGVPQLGRRLSGHALEGHTRLPMMKCTGLYRCGGDFGVILLNVLTNVFVGRIRKKCKAR